MAIYIGTGTIDDAANFVCKMPGEHAAAAQ
jgi:hypothetical protein